jgi:hypothetical protein
MRRASSPRNRSLEAENAKLKHLLAEAHLDMHALKSVLGVKRYRQRLAKGECIFQLGNCSLDPLAQLKAEDKGVKRLAMPATREAAYLGANAERWDAPKSPPAPRTSSNLHQAQPARFRYTAVNASVFVVL